MAQAQPLHLNGLDVSDLYSLAGLHKIDQRFLDFLQEQAPQQAQQLHVLRQHPQALDDQAYSTWLCHTAPWLAYFLADLFHIEDEVLQRQAIAESEHPIIQFKKQCVLKEGKKRMRLLDQGPSWSDLEAWRLQRVPQIKDQEWAMARFAAQCLAASADHQHDLEQLYWWCAHVLVSRPSLVANWVSFQVPKRLDFQQLIPVQPHANQPDVLAITSAEKRQRQGFDWTDQTWSLRALHNEAHYCLFCHEKSGDFCRTGFPQKKGDPSQGLRQNSLEAWLVGCPLDQKISEMNWLAARGHALAALATAMVDNPMCVLTGQRICNECMKACIYQKQSPVDIPKIESTLLKDVLRLPWGVELYTLLVQWNPLRRTQYLPQAFHGSRVAIMGMGPAGMTMAHHLLMAGCAVVGLDGQAIHPPPASWQAPIHRYESLEHHLRQRPVYGIGGVSEYGITARWDKNLITLAYLSLIRRAHFQCYGAVRFGGTWTLNDAWRQQFDHVVIALGAGLPKALHIPNSMSVGMRTANDFLMALHLGGAGHPDSKTMAPVDLPALVIGGGLTAVDTATELQALYLQQVAQAYAMQQKHKAIWPQLKAQFSASAWQTITRWCAHGAALAAAKKEALLLDKPLDLHALLHTWGGVTMVYRKRLQDAPAYRINHEELHAAMQEGILFRPCVQPTAIVVDSMGQVSGLQVQSMSTCDEGIWHAEEGTKEILARSIWSAIGTQLNVAYSFEHAGEIDKVHAFQYQAHTWEAQAGLQVALPGQHCKTDQVAIFTQIDVRAGVSFIGDSHPAFHGSVVKAMGSAKRGYPAIMARLDHQRTAHLSARAYQGFVAGLQSLFCTRLVAQRWLADDVVQWDVHAPMIAQAWQPGTLCRWQPNIALSNGAVQAFCPPLFMVPIAVDRAAGLLTFYHVVDSQAARHHFDGMKVGDNLAMMGPTGVRLSRPQQPSGLLFFVSRAWMPTLLSVLAPFAQQGHRLFVVVHDGPEPIGRARLNAHCAQWVMAGVTQDGWQEMPHQAAYWQRLHDWLGAQTIQHVYGLVDATSMRFLQQRLQPGAGQSQPSWLAPDATVTGQALGPMQCGLKGVCAQCLQWQVDPTTGQRTKAVYGCSWQNQPMQSIDLQHLETRQQLFEVQQHWHQVLAQQQVS